MTDQSGKNITVTQCPACEGSDLKLFVEEKGSRIDRCVGCGLLFANPRPSMETIRGFFTDEYITTEESIDQSFTSHRIASLLREAQIIKDLLPEGGRMLDAGTASGVFLSLFKDEKHWDVEGIEPSPFAAKTASKRHKVKVQAGFLGDHDFEDESFNIVTSLDAFLFHPDPNKDADEVFRILKPGGLFALDLPGFRFRLLKGTGPIAWLIYRKRIRLHIGKNLYYYNRDTLTKLLSRHGFEFVTSYAEQSPVYGSPMLQVLNHSYYKITTGLYRLTKGYFNLAPKEFLIFRKVSS